VERLSSSKQAANESQKFVVQNPAGLDIEFSGSVLVDYTSQSAGRIRVFRTDSGRYVIEQTRSALRGRTALHRVAVIDTLDEMAEILSDTTGGKRVMEELGRPCRLKV
jgi:hypothetical protein